MKEKIEKILRENLNIEYLKVENQSNLHDTHQSSPKNGNSHFHLIIQSSDFNGRKRVENQKKVYTILSEIIPEIHAISMDLRDF